MLNVLNGNELVTVQGLANNGAPAATTELATSYTLAAVSSLGNAIRLPNWRIGLGNVRAGIADTTILMVGDSTIMGYNSVSTTNQMRYNGISKFIANALTNIGITAESNGWAGDGGNRGTASETSQYDSRITVGSGWSTSGVAFVGGASFTASASTSSLSFEPTVSVNTFVVTYFQFSGGGSFQYNLNGGSNTTQSCNGGNAIKTVTVTGTLQSNTLNLNWVSGTVYILGIDAYNSAGNQVHVINAGWDGSQSADWAGIVTVSGVSSYQLGQSLTIICLGINDADVGVSLTTYTNNMQAVITACLAQGDVALMTYPPSNPSGFAPIATQNSFNNTIRSLAASNNLPLVDIYARFVSWAVSGTGLYGGNSLHPNGAGYADEAQNVLDVLLN